MSDTLETPEENVTLSAFGTSVAEAVTSASVPITSRFHALALAVHYALLDCGFVCTGSEGEDRGALAGFAPAARRA